MKDIVASVGSVRNVRYEQKPPFFATVTEACEALHLSRTTVHELIKSGEIPSKKFGTAVRIPWEWILRQAELKEV
ncbi:MAG: helix-turn-helix domain-containing protein [Bryobacteraceae bacterium]